MGYYITLKDSSVAIPMEHAEAALEAIHKLGETHDHLKRGGAWSNGEKTKKWFSWMPADLREITTLKDMLETIGFEVAYNSPQDQLNITGYDSKTGQEDLFIWALTPYIVHQDIDARNDGVMPEMEWLGEDGATYLWKFTDKKFIRSYSTVEWSNDELVTF
jgi:hypothetical protein